MSLRSLRSLRLIKISGVDEEFYRRERRGLKELRRQGLKRRPWQLTLCGTAMSLLFGSLRWLNESPC